MTIFNLIMAHPNPISHEKFYRKTERPTRETKNVTCITTHAATEGAQIEFAGKRSREDEREWWEERLRGLNKKG